MPSGSTVSLATRLLITFVSTTIVLPASISLAYAQGTTTQQPVMPNGQQQPGATKLTEAQLAALVAPIALYPDPLVSQVLMASTYPLEVAEAYNWQRSNSRLSGGALNQALQQQNWDPSVKSLVSFAPVLGMMGTQLGWTQNLGNAVLAQQSDVMTAIQDLRAKARATGALKSNAQQTVTTQGSGSSETIIIQPANPQVVYVPTYNPALVYGTWGYPAYPPYSYYPPGYVAGTALLSFGLGMAVGAALWGGCNWGGGGWNHWGGGWGGGNSLTVNNNTFNNFNRGTNTNWASTNRTGSSNWQPNMQRVNSSLGGSANNALRNEQRDQLRQNMQRDGFSGGERGGLGGANRGGLNGADRGGLSGAERSGGERGGLNGDRSSGSGRFGSDQKFGGGERSGGQRDPGGFGSGHHSSFGGGEHFGGGGSHSGGGSHFGGGRR